MTGSSIRERSSGVRPFDVARVSPLRLSLHTFERLHGAVLFVEKRSGEREPFRREKVIAGVRAACKNRPVEDEQLIPSPATLRICCSDSVRRSRPSRWSRRARMAPSAR